MKKRGPGQPPIMLPCAWCRKEMPTGERRKHEPHCPARPKKKKAA